MSESQVFSFAQEEPSPDPPQRLWLGDRHAESVTICRWPDGKYAPRPNDAPQSQLLLFGEAA